MTPPAFVKLAPQGTRPRTMQKQLRYHRAAAFGSTAGSRLECLDVEHAANEREPAARRPAPHNQLDADGTAGPAHRTALHGVPVFEGGRWVHKRREGGRKLEAHHQPGAFPGAFPDVSFRAMLQKKNEAAALQHAEVGAPLFPERECERSSRSCVGRRAQGAGRTSRTWGE